MKKLLPLLLCVCLLAGCSAPAEDPTPAPDPTDEPPTTQIVNPWKDYSSAAEMEAFLGFDFSVPEEVNGMGAVSAYRAMENLGEVQYEEGLVLRKSEGSGDVSGDYTEYKDSHTASTLDESGVVEMFGEGEVIYKAIWEMGGYTYAATCPAGMEVHIFAQMIAQIQ